MKIISHRGNLNGPHPKLENSPSYILQALNIGLDCEIDIWYDNGIYLGHDKPTYLYNLDDLYKYSKYLWIHCKNFDSLKYFIHLKNYNFNFFWHERDLFTLTSNGFIWNYYTNMSQTKKTIIIDFMGKNRYNNIYGICTDFPLKYKKNNI